MNTGQVISGVAHIGLLGVAIFGGAFKSEPLPFQVTEVTAISEAEYAALIAEPEPEAVANINTPEAPQESQAPEIASQADEAPAVSQPEAAEVSPQDAVPDVEEPAPLPEAEVSDTPPELQSPPEDVAVLVPEPDSRPSSRPAPRVAPQPVAQPEPDVEIADVDQQATTADDTAEEVEPEQQETAREEAADRIVTEAEEEAERLEAAAPSRSARPKTRPARPQPEEAEPTQTAEQAPEPDTATGTATDQAAIDAALAEAVGEETRAAQGPPLTVGEKDGLRVAVQQCWNVGSLSSDALSTTVTVAVSMGEDAKPLTGSIRMIDSSGGTAASARQAFEAARRAIIRCGARGYDLPVEKYAAWRDIEMTFNPERMRIK